VWDIIVSGARIVRLNDKIPSGCEEIVAHLEVLSTSFDRYFDVGKVETSDERIMNPCSFNLNKMSDDRDLKED